MRAKLGVSVSGRYRLDENLSLTKHVVAAGSFAKDAGSTPAASTILRSEHVQCFEGLTVREVLPLRVFQPYLDVIY